MKRQQNERDLSNLNWSREGVFLQPHRNSSAKIYTTPVGNNNLVKEKKSFVGKIKARHSQ